MWKSPTRPLIGLKMLHKDTTFKKEKKKHEKKFEIWKKSLSKKMLK